MADTVSYLLLQTGDKVLQETGDKILLQTQAVAVSGVTQTGVMLDNFSLTDCANRGEVGTGGFDVYDSASALTIPALRAAVVSEPLSLTAPLLYSGYTHDRTIAPIQNGVARAWGVEVTDLNILAREFVLTEAESADRPAETDYERIAWLMTTRFATAEAGIIVGVLPNTNTVMMEATDYRGRYAADVLAECSEAASKLWFIYHYDETGRGLYYDLASGTFLRTTTKISDAGDADGSTIFHPIGTPTVIKSPDRIYSTVHLRYNGGTVSVTNATTADTYRTREIAVTDNSINNSTLATTKANALLANAAAEITEIDGLELVVPALYVNSIRAGNAVQIKLIRQGIAAYTYYRVTRRTIQPTGTADNRYYHLSLGLASDVLPSANGGGREVYQNTSNANDDGVSVVIDRDGLVVHNPDGVVIIDGTSNMFKILTTGTLTATAAAWAAGVVVEATSSTAALTALGTFTTPPMALGVFTTAGAAKTIGRRMANIMLGYTSPVYTASTSGGSPTTRVIGTSGLAYLQTTLDASDYAIVTLVVDNVAGSSYAADVRYHLLKEQSV
jgi:hypothetical protein